MSGLNSLFSRGTIGTRCKTCLNLAISRIKLLRNKREAQLVAMRKEIFQFLRTGQETIARIRVEHVIREQNILAAYEILEIFCEFVLARVPIIESQKECPVELQESIASIIFASSRCSDLPELIHIKNLFVNKYGKEFVQYALELRPESNVNRSVIENLSVKAPSGESKLNALKQIALENGLDWDSSATEADFSKKYEDLLDGSKPIGNESSSQTKQTSPKETSRKISKQETTQISKNSISPTKSIEEEKLHAIRDESGILERARSAILLAEQACVAARAAEDLAKVKLF
ncbi:hypothetical protein LUZ60_008053 [Juncus effusus]|nr:hypothetical protein LUZ60_008053 [Juncus effusus]